MVDMFFFRETEEAEKEAEVAAGENTEAEWAQDDAPQVDWTAGEPVATDAEATGDWGADGEWAEPNNATSGGW